MINPIDRSIGFETTDSNEPQKRTAVIALSVTQQGTRAVETQAFSQARNKKESEGSLVQLSPPQQITQTVLAVTQTEIARIFQSAGNKEFDVKVVFQPFAELLRAGLESSSSIEIDFLKSMSETQRAEVALKIKELRVIREVNENKIKENQEKIEKSSEAINEAKKSGLAQKIFGWLSAIVSVVIGAVMIATGFGAIAGALMIAGGVTNMASMAVQQAAEDGLISKEVMATLGPIMMAIVIVVAVAGIAVSFGSLALAGVAKITAKLGTKGAEIASKLTTKAAEFSMKVQGAVASGARSVKLGMDITNTSATVMRGTADAVHSGYQVKSLNKQADTQQARYELDDKNKQMEIITEALRQLFDVFAAVIDSLADVQHIIDRMVKNLSSIPSIKTA